MLYRPAPITEDGDVVLRPPGKGEHATGAESPVVAVLAVLPERGARLDRRELEALRDACDEALA